MLPLWRFLRSFLLSCPCRRIEEKLLTSAFRLIRRKRAWLARGNIWALYVSLWTQGGSLKISLLIFVLYNLHTLPTGLGFSDVLSHQIIKSKSQGIIKKVKKTVWNSGKTHNCAHKNVDPSSACLPKIHLNVQLQIPVSLFENGDNFFPTYPQDGCRN